MVGNIGASYIVETFSSGYQFQCVKGDDVECDTMDNLLDLNDITVNNIMIKMDIEGHEYQALLGMSNLLNDTRTSRIIIELNPSTTSRANLFIIVDFIVEQGFSESHLLFNSGVNKWAGEMMDIYDAPHITIELIKQRLLEGRILEVVFSR